MLNENMDPQTQNETVNNQHENRPLDTTSPVLHNNQVKSLTNDNLKDSEVPLLLKGTDLSGHKNDVRNKEDKKKHHRHKWVKTDIIRNLAVVGLVWFGVFTAYHALENLQSSLNPKYGVISISLIYGFKVLTSLFGPLIVKKFTPKWCMLFGCVCHTVYVVANFYPVWYLLLPAGVLVGTAMGPLWICLGIYITVLSVKYADITDENKTGVLSKFNGIIQAVIPLTFISGNLITSAILQNVHFYSVALQNMSTSTMQQAVYSTNNSNINNSYFVMDNITHHPIEYQVTTASILLPNELLENNTYMTYPILENLCGPHYCPKPSNSTKDSDDSGPDQGALYLMIGVLLCFNLCGVLAAFFGLDNLNLHDMDEEPADQSTDTESIQEEESSLYNDLVKYLKSFFNWQFLMLIPSTIYIHLMLALMGATFTKAFVTCSLGIGMVGYISMARGITGFVTNTSSGFIGQYINRNIIFAFAVALTIAQCCLWLLWDMVLPDVIIPLYISAAIAGVANGANLIQYSAFLGDAFTDRKTEVFSFYHFWAGIAVAIGFLQNNFICVKYQIYIFLVIMGLAIITYTLLNIYLNKHKDDVERHISIETEVNIGHNDHNLKDEESITFKSFDNKPLPMSPKLHHRMVGNLLKQELQALSASQASLTMV